MAACQPGGEQGAQGSRNNRLRPEKFPWMRFRTGVQLPPPPPKRKDIRKDVLSFWVPPPKGRLHPSVFQCSGPAKPPLRHSRPQAGNLRATRRAAQKGRWVVLLQQSCRSQISILTVPFKTKRHPKGCPFVLGSGRRRRPPPSGIEMLRAAKPPFRQGFHLR